MNGSLISAGALTIVGGGNLTAPLALLPLQLAIVLPLTDNWLALQTIAGYSMQFFDARQLGDRFLICGQNQFMEWRNVCVIFYPRTDKQKDHGIRHERSGVVGQQWAQTENH